MNRKKFILSTIALYPLSMFAKLKSTIMSKPGKGFKVNAGEARFGTHYKMKGVTLNTLDIKISGSDTDGGVAVFEQTGLTPHGGPRYIYILCRMNGFTWWKENICSR